MKDGKVRDQAGHDKFGRRGAGGDAELPVEARLGPLQVVHQLTVASDHLFGVRAIALARGCEHQPVADALE